MEDSCNNILAEGESHQEFVIDILNYLAAVQDKAFMLTLEKTQDSYDSGEAIANYSIIHQTTTKYLKPISRNQ